MTRSPHLFQRALLLTATLILASCGAPETGGAGADSGTAADAPGSAATGGGESGGGESGEVSYLAERIIVGDGGVLEPGRLVVRDGMITAVDSSTTGAGRSVELSGMTIMPTLVDAHVHLSTTRAGILEDLRQRASVGVSAALSLGADGPDVPLDIREEEIPGAARYLSAGRGITAPEPGRNDVPHWVTSEAEARQAVRDEAARNVDFIKVWVDDRNGQYDKLSEALYSAIIDEAHANGLPAIAHIFALEDGKGLLRAGIDAFAHGVRERDIDAEFIALAQARPEVVLVPNLPARGMPSDLGWLDGILAADQLDALAANNVANPETQEFFGIQARNLARLNEAGMTIAMGTDGNVFWAPHVEMEDMVIAGISPDERIVAASKISAELLGLDDTGVLEPGRRADFIVLGSDPLDDITNTRDIVDVYLTGARVAR